MRFKTFRMMAATVFLGAVVGTGMCVRAMSLDAPDARPSIADTPVVPPVPPVPPAPPAVPAPAASPSPAVAIPTSQLRAELESWLSENPDRRGLMRAVDVLPQRPYRVTAVRFPDADARRFSNDPSQWSQLRIDLDRNGVDDEKWLLRNGRTYKREVLAADGRTVTETHWLDRD